MDKFSNIKKFLIIPLVVVVCFSSFTTPKAEAWVDVANLVPNLATAFSTAGSAITGSATALTTAAGFTFQNVIKAGLDGMAYTAGQLLLDQLTENTIRWIKGGFHGSPSFNVDAGKLLNDLVDAVGADLARQVRGIQMCNFTGNFQFDLANQIALSSRSNYRNKFAAQARCPFPSNISVTAFTNDFSRGGWRAFEASLYDSGNTFGMSILTGKELEARRAEQTRIQQQKLTQSGGFLDFLDTRPGMCPGMPTDAEYASLEHENTTEATKKAHQKIYCKTTTPGKVIGETLGKTLNLDMERIGFVDNINKIFGVLIHQLMSQAMTAVFSSGTQSYSQNTSTTARDKLLTDSKKTITDFSTTMGDITTKTAAESDALMAKPIKEQVAPDNAVKSLQNTINGDIANYRVTLNNLSIFILSGMGIYDGEGVIYPQITAAQAAKEAINPTLDPTFPLVTALTNLQDKQFLALQTTKLGFESLKLQMTTAGRAAALLAINAEDQVLTEQTALGVANAKYQTELNKWLSALLSLSAPLPQPPATVGTAKDGVDTAITKLTTTQVAQASASLAAIKVLAP